MGTKELETPRAESADKAYTAAKAVLSAIPGIGGPVAELFGLVVQPSLESRRIKWMEAVAERLCELQNHGVSIERLQQDEAFVSAILHATQAALRTHRAEKLEALLNAVLNIAETQAHDETLEQILLSYIDELTCSHLQLLLAAHDRDYLEGRYVSVRDLVRELLPQMTEDEVLTRVLWRDLESRGLVASNAERVSPGHSLARPGMTALGRSLVALIRRRAAT